MSSMIALLPTVPARVVIPDSMHPKEKDKLVEELGSIATSIARVETRDEERAKFADQRWRAIDARIGKLEKHASETGEHKLAIVTKERDDERAELSKVKWWAVSIVTTFATSAVVGLIVYYLSTR